MGRALYASNTIWQALFYGIFHTSQTQQTHSPSWNPPTRSPKPQESIKESKSPAPKGPIFGS
ncbi:hypothetical protein [Rubritalea tangerina]|uniref:hypothetical protein n=1 Tax=Rubritalea tangerina TaxID=430798 RepID=UPI00360761EE